MKPVCPPTSSYDAPCERSGPGGPVAFRLIPPETQSSERRTASHRVLLVEDHADVAQATATVLELLGATVCIALTGGEALARAAAFAPTLVLLDIELPDIDGHEVGRRLQQMPELAGTAFVALTSWSAPEMQQRSLAQGFVAHLLKPAKRYQFEALLGRVPIRSSAPEALP